MISWIKFKIYGNRRKVSNMLKTREIKEEEEEETDKSSIQEVQLTIIGDEGFWNVILKVDLIVERLKVMTCKYFYTPAEADKLSTKYTFLLVRERRPLKNENNLLQEGLQNNDELLLVEMLKPPRKDLVTIDQIRGPTLAQITVATQAVQERRSPQHKKKKDASSDNPVNHDIRRILTSLCEAAARTLSPTPDADRLSKLVLDRLIQRRESDINPASIQGLVNMGYNRDQAVLALNRTQLNYRRAVDWLEEHANDDPPATLPEPLSSSQEHEQEQEQEQGLEEVIGLMLRRLISIQRQEFKPNKKMLKMLKEMGFTTHQATEALWVTDNHENTACEWLLISAERESSEDTDAGLSADSPLYEAIMENTAVQLSLHNPRMLIAFLSVLENHSSLDLWFNDPEAAPVFSAIFQIYNTERSVAKH